MAGSVRAEANIPWNPREAANMRLEVKSDDALIVVDPQNDFLPGGALPVAQGHRIFDPINSVMPMFRRVYATRDWHPKNHAYFKEHGGIWPYHCLQNTPGAEFSPRLHAHRIHHMISKGTDPQTDG